MEAVRSYLLSVTAACLLAAIASALVRGDSVRKLVRFAAGLLILAVVIMPLLRIDVDGLSEKIRAYRSSLSVPTEENDWDARFSALIKETSEAYIEEKAAALGAVVKAEVTLSEDDYPQPIGVRIVGILSSEQRRELAAYLETAFAVGADAQEWRVYDADG